MNRIRFTLALVGASACVLGVSALAARQPTIQDEVDMAKGMEEWQKAMTPGPQHEALARHIGTWDVTMKMFQAPGAPPMESKGTAVVSWRIENYWLQEEFSGEMMGMPYKGFGLHGYDNYKKQYVSSWVSNMSTSILNQQGSLSQDKKTLTMFGTMDEPITGEKGKIVRSQVTTIDDDHFVFRVDEVQYGDPFTVVEIDYVRRK